jgi:hypothetical protein
MVVDDAFDRVEEAKTEQHRARKKFARPEEMTPLRAAPEHEQAGDHEQVCGTVEDAVPKRVELEVLDAVHGIPAAQHVVPLKELVQDDPVEKSAEPKAEQDPSRSGKVVPIRVHTVAYALAVAPNQQ